MTTRKYDKRCGRSRFVVTHRYGPGPKLHRRTGWHTPKTLKVRGAQSQQWYYQHKRLLLQSVLALAAFIAITRHSTIQWGIIVMAMLVVHECGHLLALKWYGFKTQGIFVIPELGAVVPMPIDVLQSRRQEAAIALAGPLAGCLGSFTAQCLYYVTGNRWLTAFAFASACLNLFNMVPLLPLDGGRACRAFVFSCNKRAGNWYLCGSLFIASAMYRLIGFGLTLIMVVATVAYWAWELQADSILMNRIDKIKIVCGYVATCIALITMLVWPVVVDAKLLKFFSSS